MDKSLKVSLQVSLLIHVFILASFPIRERKVVSIPLNIDLIKIKPIIPKKEPEAKKDDFAKKQEKIAPFGQSFVRCIEKM